MTDFYAALKNGNMPTISFLKAPAYQDGHAGYSDPLDEQEFVTQVVNSVQNSLDWKDTAIVILYDDSDGWYDHAHAVVNPSESIFGPIRRFKTLERPLCFRKAARRSKVNAASSPGAPGASYISFRRKP